MIFFFANTHMQSVCTYLSTQFRRKNEKEKSIQKYFDSEKTWIYFYDRREFIGNFYIFHFVDKISLWFMFPSFRNLNNFYIYVLSILTINTVKIDISFEEKRKRNFLFGVRRQKKVVISIEHHFIMIVVRLNSVWNHCTLSKSQLGKCGFASFYVFYHQSENLFASSLLSFWVVNRNKVDGSFFVLLFFSLFSIIR